MEIILALATVALPVFYFLQLLFLFIGCSAVGPHAAMRDLKIKSRWGLLGWFVLPGFPVIKLITVAIFCTIVDLYKGAKQLEQRE
jgi:hypothetical protein